MASVAHISAIDVRGTLTTGVGTVVTIDTVIHKIGMVDSRRCPLRSGMTHITLIRGLDMGGALACGNGAIMTTRTNTQYFIVVHVGRCHRLPRRRTRCVAGIAIVRAVDM